MGEREPWPDFSNTSKVEQLTLSCPEKTSGNVPFCLHSLPCYQTWFKFPLRRFQKAAFPAAERKEEEKTFPYYSSNNEFLLGAGRFHVFSVKRWWQPCRGTFPGGCGHNGWGLVLTGATLGFPSSLALLSPEIRHEKWLTRSCLCTSMAATPLCSF